MKKLIAGLLILSVIMPFIAGYIALAEEKEELNIPVKQLHADPAPDSKIIYDIPISVNLLDISVDGNWYKVKISYALGPFNYTYTGWSNIPVGKILSERERKANEIASLTKEK